MTYEPWQMKEKGDPALRMILRPICDRYYSSFSIFSFFCPLSPLRLCMFSPRTNFHAGTARIWRDNLSGIWGSGVIRAKLVFSTKSSGMKVKPAPPLFCSHLKSPVKVFSCQPRPPLPSVRLWGIKPVKPTVQWSSQHKVFSLKFNWKANNSTANKQLTPSCWIQRQHTSHLL